MNYLDRLKVKISEDAPDHKATKVTKAPSVPFVAVLSAPSRQISAAELRQAKVIDKLQAEAELRCAMETHINAEPEAVILTLAIREKGACELRIPKSNYDAFALLELIEKHTIRGTLQ